MSGSLTALPPGAAEQARQSVGAALTLAPATGQPGAFTAAVDQAFYTGLQPACFTVGFVALAGALFAAAFLPARRLYTAEAPPVATSEPATVTP